MHVILKSKRNGCISRFIVCNEIKSRGRRWLYIYIEIEEVTKYFSTKNRPGQDGLFAEFYRIPKKNEYHCYSEGFLLNPFYDASNNLIPKLKKDSHEEN